jgi:hypothetical protein
MAVGVDATWRHDAPGRVDLARAGRKVGAELHDATLADADVAVERVRGSGDTGAADHQVEGRVSHGRPPGGSAWCAARADQVQTSMSTILANAMRVLERFS